MNTTTDDLRAIMADTFDYHGHVTCDLMDAVDELTTLANNAQDGMPDTTTLLTRAIACTDSLDRILSDYTGPIDRRLHPLLYDLAKQVQDAAARMREAAPSPADAPTLAAAHTMVHRLLQASAFKVQRVGM